MLGEAVEELAATSRGARFGQGRHDAASGLPADSMRGRMEHGLVGVQLLDVAALAFVHELPPGEAGMSTTVPGEVGPPSR